MQQPQMAREQSVPSFAMELKAPDISPYRVGNTGINYVHRFDSGEPGPHALVNVITHGNEICGAIALDFLFRQGIRPRRGVVTLCFANTAAYERFDPANPGASRFVDEDFNRVWALETLEGRKRSVELERARELRPVFEQADFLLDVHSMSTASVPLMLCHGLEKERAFALKVGYPSMIVCGPGHVEGLRMIEHSPFNNPANPQVALLVEAGEHWAAATAVHALDTVLRFLAASGSLDFADVEPHIADKVPPRPRLLEVTDGIVARTNRFRFTAPFVGCEVFEQVGSVIAYDGDREIVTPSDGAVLIMPNHSGPGPGRKGRLCRAVDERSADGT